MENAAGEGTGVRLADCSDDTRQKSSERVPRGRCQPPIAPAPNPRRGELMAVKNKDLAVHSVNRSSRRHPSRIVMMTKGGRAAPHKPMPRWKMGYVGFKRKVKSSALVPLLLTVVICGAGSHGIGFAGVSLGYFTWSVRCEGVVTVAGEGDRANGVQTYNLGWARYEGTGPTTASNSPTVDVDSNNGTAGSDLGKGGIAGSSIAEEGWLLDIDVVSALFGGLNAVGHLAGFAFYAVGLFTAQRLFRSQFRSDRCLFRPAAKGAVLLLMWTVVVGSVGFYASARESFTRSVLTTLHSEDFLCQDDSNFGGEFSFIATGFGCVASALMFLLTWWFGHAADLALSDRFQMRKESLAGIGP